MSFFSKLFNHLLNQFLVEGLANSRTFQRFAVWSHKTGKELAEKSKEHSKVIDQHVGSVTEQAKAFALQFRKELEKEVTKLNQQQQPPTKR